MAIKRLLDTKAQEKLQAKKTIGQKFEAALADITDPKVKRALRILGKLAQGKKDDEA